MACVRLSRSSIKGARRSAVKSLQSRKFQGGVSCVVVEWLCLFCTAPARINQSKPMVAAGSACRTFGKALPRHSSIDSIYKCYNRIEKKEEDVGLSHGNYYIVSRQDFRVYIAASRCMWTLVSSKLPFEQWLHLSSLNTYSLLYSKLGR